MNNDKLIETAKNVMQQVKMKACRDKCRINPFASFADHMIALINNGRISSREDVYRFTGMIYPRPRMKKMWRGFGEILKQNSLPSDIKKLLRFFGYLKRLLTIEGKEENRKENNFKNNKSRQWDSGLNSHRKSKKHRGKSNFSKK